MEAGGKVEEELQRSLGPFFARLKVVKSVRGVSSLMNPSTLVEIKCLLGPRVSPIQLRVPVSFTLVSTLSWVVEGGGWGREVRFEVEVPWLE